MRGQRLERRGQLRLNPGIRAERHPTLADLPALGLGIGLRSVHFNEILQRWPAIDWFEAISENFMDSRGRPRAVLRQIAERYPVVLHGVSLSIGSTDPLRQDYLRRLKQLADDVAAAWVSDHLCWTGVGGHNSHDLLPLPLNGDTLRHVAARVNTVQEQLERPLILENPSSYVGFAASDLTEPEFLRALCEETGCGLLLDVNNIYVTCFNRGWDPLDYLADVPWERVVQFHLAGHEHCGTHIVDTHDQPVCDDVWNLYAYAAQHSAAPTLLEWDGDVPDLDRVHAEVLRAQEFMGGPVAAPSDRRPGETGERVVSTPVDFMLPDVMEHSTLEPSSP